MATVTAIRGRPGRDTQDRFRLGRHHMAVEGGYGLQASDDGTQWQRLPTPDGFNQLRIDGNWIADAGGMFIYLTIESETESQRWIGTLRS